MTGLASPWFCLFFAGILEVVWAVALKHAAFSRPGSAILLVVALVGSLGLLSHAMRFLPVGTAYAVWTGIGAVGTVIYGIAFMRESASPARLLCITLILVGILGLRIVR